MIGSVPRIKLRPVDIGDEDPSYALSGERRVFFSDYNGFRPTPIYDGSSLQPGNVIVGPAVVEETNTTVVVFPDWKLEFTPFGCYVMHYQGGLG